MGALERKTHSKKYSMVDRIYIISSVNKLLLTLAPRTVQEPKHVPFEKYIVSWNIFS